MPLKILGPWGPGWSHCTIFPPSRPPRSYPTPSSSHLTLPPMHQAQSYLRTFAQAVPATWAALPLDNFVAPPSTFQIEIFTGHFLKKLNHLYSYSNPLFCSILLLDKQIWNLLITRLPTQLCPLVFVTYTRHLINVREMKASELSAIRGVEGRGAALSSTFSGLCLSLEADPRTAAWEPQPFHPPPPTPPEAQSHRGTVSCGQGHRKWGSSAGSRRWNWGGRSGRWG